MSPLSVSPRGVSGLEGGGQTLAALAGDTPGKDYALPFFHYLTIPKNTAVATPLEYVFELPIGMVNKLWIGVPSGVNGLAGVQIWRREQQIFPLPAGNWFRTDDLVASFSFTHSIHNEPYEVRLFGYNLDDTYVHTIWFSFEMTGLSDDLPPQLAGLLNYLKGG